jgi:hypothetical protein
MNMHDQVLYDRIMARCVETPGPLDTPCLIWQRSCRSAGYGVFMYDNKRYATHRAAYMAVHGPIEPGLSVMHKCDVPKCCNVNHLHVGTQFENMQDVIKKGRRPQTIKKLQPERVSELRRLYTTEGVSTIRLAAMFNMDRRCVARIVNGRTWAHLLPPKETP